MRRWHDEITAGVRSMQDQGKVPTGIDAERTAAALLAGIQGGVGILLATGDLGYLEAALDLGIGSLRRAASYDTQVSLGFKASMQQRVD